jgi:hypothetical protein
MAQRNVLAAAPALWLPNVVFLVFGAVLFALVARERPLLMPSRLGQGLAALRLRSQPVSPP